MNFFGILLSLVGIGCMIYCAYILFKDLIKPLYEEIYLKKKFERDLFNKVRWIALKNFQGFVFINGNPKDVRNQDLIWYILNEQQNLEIDNIHQINISNENEKNFISEILEATKENVKDSLFSNCLKCNKEIFKLGFVEYYFFYLYEFLDRTAFKHHSPFYDRMYHHYKKSDYGEWDIYDLKDFGIAYYKLYFIVSKFCETNEKTKKLISSHISKNIKQILVDKAVKCISYQKGN